MTQDDNPAVTARRAEIAAEEARLSALRAARLRLEQDVATLERDLAAQRQPRASALAWAGPAMTVVLHHRTGAAAAAATLAEALRGTPGLTLEPLRETSFAPSTPVIRFFHPADEEPARRLAAGLGGGWAVQDFRAYQPRPAARTIELWLAAE